MLWVFDRNGQRLRCEINRDRTSRSYRLTLIHPDGSETSEHVAEAGALVERSVALMHTLRLAGWKIG